MKISFVFPAWVAIFVCTVRAADLVSKIFPSSRGMSLNHDTADGNCVGTYQAMSDVLVQAGELKGTINQISQTMSQFSQLGQTVNQMSQTMIQLSQTVSQLSQTVDQLSHRVDQQSSHKDVCENDWISFGDSCYYFSLKDEYLSWPDALVECRSKGAYLAEISDQQENRFLETQAQFLGSAAISGVSVMDCRDSFLTGEKAIPDSAFTASSVYATYSPERGRLDTQKSGSKHGAWAGASATDVTQWIQADLGQSVKVTGVITQGRQDGSLWVKTFVVYYSLDCIHWSPVEEQNGSQKIFSGNTDRNTKKTNIFLEPVTARCVRINPRTWEPYVPGMRFDVIGCPLESAAHEMSLWLGGTDILQEHEFLWATSGTRISYDTFRDWHPRQPDNAEDSEHCLMMDQHSGWHDAACSELKRYVCEKDNK